MKDDWVTVNGYEGMYEVNSDGEIKSLKRERRNGRAYYMQKEIILKKTFTTTGYYKVELTKNKKRKSLRVHRLVARAFLGEHPKEKDVINHKDGNPLNNNVKNLEWCTQKENCEHAIKIGLKKSFKIDKEELRECLKTMSGRQIAEKYNTQTHTIFYKVTKYGLQGKNYIKKTGITPGILKDKLKTMKQRELAEELGCTQGNISHMISKYKRRGLL